MAIKKAASKAGSRSGGREVQYDTEVYQAPTFTQLAFALGATRQSLEALMNKRLAMPIAVLQLATNVANRLEERGIFTIRDLLNLSVAELNDIGLIGDKTRVQIFEGLENLGFFRESRGPNGQQVFSPGYSPDDAVDAQEVG